MMRSLIYIPVDDFKLEGELVVPPNAKSIVIFAHGSGSSRHSPRNKFVAQHLTKRSIATLLVDLLSEKEDINQKTRFDIRLLTERLTAITKWVQSNQSTKHMNIGYFGTSTGAAASMLAAIDKDEVKAVVSRGGRVDMAFDANEALNVPTLFIVGGADYDVMRVNKEVFEQLSCKKKLVEIPHATHLFEEPGALEQVAEQAGIWFEEYLKK